MPLYAQVHPGNLMLNAGVLDHGAFSFVPVCISTSTLSDRECCAFNAGAPCLCLLLSLKALSQQQACVHDFIECCLATFAAVAPPSVLVKLV